MNFEKYGIEFFFCLLLIGSIGFSGAAQESLVEYAEDSRANGKFCISGTDLEVSDALERLKTLGVIAELQEVGSIPCDTKHAIRFPYGLEYWTRTQLRSFDLEVFNPQYSSAGSGIFRADLQTSNVLSDVPNPENLPSLREELDCKIQNRLSPDLFRIASSSCEGGANGLCYNYHFFGHTATSTLFSPEAFNQIVDDGFWFRIKAQFLFGDHGEDGSGRKTMTAVAVVQETRFARRPSSEDEPASTGYNYLDHFYPSVDGYELDNLANNILANALFSEKLTCENTK